MYNYIHLQTLVLVDRNIFIFFGTCTYKFNPLCTSQFHVPGQGWGGWKGTGGTGLEGVSFVPGSKLLMLGMVIPPLIRNPYHGQKNPYYWVDDHPLLSGNNGSLDPGTYVLFWTHVFLSPWFVVFFLVVKVYLQTKQY